jgi:hypothetical protein
MDRQTGFVRCWTGSRCSASASSRVTHRVRRPHSCRVKRRSWPRWGKISAGLAYELNNPAAAAGVRNLRESFQRFTARLNEHESSQRSSISALENDLGHGADVHLDSLERSDCQEKVIRNLERHGVARLGFRPGACGARVRSRGSRDWPLSFPSKCYPTCCQVAMLSTIFPRLCGAPPSISWAMLASSSGSTVPTCVTSLPLSKSSVILFSRAVVTST